MEEKKTAVTGIYQYEKQAEEAVPGLLAAGFTNDAISIAKAPEGPVGGVRLAVRSVTSEQVTCAKDVLKQTGAQDISSSAEKPDQVFVES
jgi:hypothetical protein